MKRLSGEFLSRVLLVLQQCNQREMQPQQLMAALQTALGAGDLYVDIETANTPQQRPGESPARLCTFDTASLDKLNAMLPWSSYCSLDHERVLGSAWSSKKRIRPEVFPDVLVERLNDRWPMAGKDVLELGCFEGHHSASLARHARCVWAVDGRIENVIKTLIRVWLSGADSRVIVNLLDLERGTLRAQLAQLGRDQSFDLIHHRGVLYHLSNPVDHLAQCAEVCTGSIYLHTQVAPEGQAKDTLRRGDRSYAVFRYKEPKVDFAPFAGITPHAHWLTETSLTAVLTDIGFARVEVIAREEERNGPRLQLIASRTK